MSQPLPAATGSRRGPTLEDVLTAGQHIGAKLALVLDCLRRAADGLNVDEGTSPDWRYVADQLGKAGTFLKRAEVMARLEIPVTLPDDDDLWDDDDVVELQGAIIPLSDLIDKGGEA